MNENNENNININNSLRGSITRNRGSTKNFFPRNINNDSHISVQNRDLEGFNFKNNNLSKKTNIIINKKNINDNIIISNDIICPICKDICIINFKNFKFNLDCQEHNEHNYKKDYQLLENFEKKQNILYINCHECKKEYNGNISNNESFFCFQCHKNLCRDCKSKHSEKNINHIIVDKRFEHYICKEHGQKFISYCKQCGKNKNLCSLCKSDHYKNNNNHEIIDYRKPNYDVEKNFNELKKKINIFKDEINSLIDKLKYVIGVFDILFRMNEKIFNNYLKEKKGSYQLFKNLDNINEFNTIILKEISIILEEKDIGNKYKLVNSLKNKLINSESKNNNNNKRFSEGLKVCKVNNIIFVNREMEIPIEYNCLENKKIKLMVFGKDFVNKNKDNFKIIIDNDEKDLSQYIETNIAIIKIKLRIKVNIENIKDISSMFYQCTSLYSVDFSNFNNFKLNKMNNLFTDCEALSSIKGISNWNITNVKDISYMFKGCKKLKELPDISKWDTSNINTMQKLFSECINLNRIPDISNWNIEHCNDLSYLFSDCHSLVSKPKIEKWKIICVKDISYMFADCQKLEYLPDLSKWDISNISKINNLFQGCKNLIALPDISNWNISKITDLTSIFDSCEKLKYLPDISKWDTTKVSNMNKLFNNCYNLLSLPDISKWKIDNVKNMSHMFDSCQDLEEILNISEWVTTNVIEMNYMFCSCKSLKTIDDIRRWDIRNVKTTEFMFYECIDLIFPFDISLWRELYNVPNIQHMFDYIDSINQNQIRAIEEIRARRDAQGNNQRAIDEPCLVI